jgi:type IV secretory pathway TraG/TraD family ATPase VirD4
MIPTELSFGKGDQWKELAQGALAMLMHAAACDDRSMRTVYRWIANADDPDTFEDVVAALETSRERKVMQVVAKQFFTNHKPTRDGIITAMTPALTWLRDSRIVSIGDAQGEDLFELANVLHEGGTIYIIGEESHTTSGLVTALISEIVRGARREANTMRRQRLDPPLAFCLDEAALVCWVPLHEWTAELRARGITIHIAIQARSQLRGRWGDKNTDTIFTNCTAVLVYGGCKSPEDLKAYEALTGWREEKLDDGPGRRVPVLTTGEIASLEGGTALVFRRDMRPFLGRPKLVWERADYKRSRREKFVLNVDTNYEAEMRKEEVA